MAVIGGKYIIQTTIQWGDHELANELLDIWGNHITGDSRVNTYSLLRTSEELMQRGRFTIGVSLLNSVINNRELQSQEKTRAYNLVLVGLLKLHEISEDTKSLNGFKYKDDNMIKYLTSAGIIKNYLEIYVESATQHNEVYRDTGLENLIEKCTLLINASATTEVNK